MLIWFIAAVVALSLAALLYARQRRTRATAIAAALRVVAVLLGVGLAFDAPRGPAGARTPMVALDASASWRRGRADTAWASARMRARAAARGDTVWLVGDSLRPAGASSAPQDPASRIAPAVDRAAGLGRPLVLVTDGEVDDPAALERALAGSSVDAVGGAPGPDAGVLGLELPRSTVGGDSVEIRVRLAAGAGGAPAGQVSLSVDRTPLARLPFEALAPFGERDLRVNTRIPVEGDGHRLVRAVVAAPGDLVAQNDSLAAALDVAAVPRAVFVSTAPDQDARFALEVLRGTLAIAVRAYYRVAPGAWRQEPGFTVATESDVRRALAEAPISILHGDTALFGSPRAVTSGALALLVPAAEGGDGDEWYVVGAPVSPLSASFAGLPWDSLPPVALGTPPSGSWKALTARRPRTLRDERVLIAGSEQPRRIVVVAGSGYWRWRFRGGVSADAFVAVWGGVFDWMAAGGDDRRGAVPATSWTRTGEPVAWRRGARRDSVVLAVLRPLDGGRADSVMLHFPGDAIMAESPSLPVGAYDVTVPGGRALLVVAQSREWLARRPTVVAGPVGTARAVGLAPRLRDAWWPYVVLVLALAAEWLVRRREGLR